MLARARPLSTLWPAFVAAAFFALLHAGSPRPAAHAAEASATTAPTLREHRSRWFVIRTDAPLSRASELAQTLDAAVDRFLERTADLGLPARAPQRPLLCVFFSDHADFLRFAADEDHVDASWMGGYYAAARNRVVAYDDASGAEFGAALAACRGADGASTERRRALQREAWNATREKLLHEAAHLLAFNTGLQNPNTAYPAWLTEGLAESFARGAFGAHANAPARAPRHDCPVADALTRGEYPSPGSPSADIDAFYAQSLALIDAMIARAPADLAALFRDIERAPTDASAATLARAVAARFAADPTIRGATASAE